MNFKFRTFGLAVLFSTLIFSCNNQQGEDKKVIYENSEESDAGEPVNQPPAQKPAATTQITFEETEHNFGNLDDGMIVNHTFKFKNTGNAPLVISDARADCGCTIPSWTKEPILPGKEGKIEVKYNSTGKGGQEITKTVTVIANTEPADNKLLIKAKVKAKPSGSPYKNK